MTILVSDAPFELVATAFTPHCDGCDEVLQGRLAGYKLQHFSIFNRRGQRVFTNGRICEGWHGTFGGQDAPMDTDYWMIVATTGSGANAVFRVNMLLR